MIEESAAYSMCVKMAMPTANDPLVSLRRSIERSATAFTKPRMIPIPTKMYRMVKTFPVAVAGVRSPYPTVVSVTTLK